MRRDHQRRRLPGVGEIDDDLEGVPWWDAKALRMVEALERSITRLRLDSQAEFVAIINAIEVQLESREAEPLVVRHLVDGLRALIAARPLHERNRRSLAKRLDELVKRVEASPGASSTR